MGTLEVRPLTALDLKRIMERLAPWEGYQLCELFAGKALLSLAALRAGAFSALLVEKDVRLSQRLKQKWRGDERVKVWQLDFRIAIRRIKAHGWQYDLVFLDPPFEKKLLALAVRQATESELIKPGGILLVKSSLQEWLEPVGNWESIFIIKRSDICLGAWLRLI